MKFTPSLYHLYTRIKVLKLRDKKVCFKMTYHIYKPKLCARNLKNASFAYNIFYTLNTVLTYFNPYHADFLNGIIHLTFLVLSIIILGILRLKLEVGQLTV